MIDTSNNPAATVLITTKDRKDDLARAIGSVVEQTAPVELIVVDDGSTDGTSELVRERFPDATLIRNEQPLGIIEARNRDELAFILAHEAAHHILDHLGQQRRNAQIGATILGRLIGGGAQTQRTAQQIGAAIGARTYSKDFELEADALGTRITIAGGYDPLRGAAFFERIPDPGNQFLGTHPANADRLETVRRVAVGQ